MTTNMMLGAIVGDIAGSTYEHRNCKRYQDIEIFRKHSHVTDDTVLTLATADYYFRTQIQNETLTFTQVYREWGNLYPRAGYGRAFR